MLNQGCDFGGGIIRWKLPNYSPQLKGEDHHSPEDEEDPQGYRSLHSDQSSNTTRLPSYPGLAADDLVRQESPTLCCRQHRDRGWVSNVPHLKRLHMPFPQISGLDYPPRKRYLI